MIKSITVTNYLGESLMMELADPLKTGLAITSISGLGPTKANIYKTDMSTVDGSVFNSARTETRNIVITMVLMENSNNADLNTIEKLRLRVYRYFPTKRKVTLNILSENRDVVIDGYVESCEASIFSSLEAAQISIICPDPWFKAKTSDSSIFSSINSVFSFPFNNVINENEPYKRTLEMSAYETDHFRKIYYTGEDESGMVIEVHFTGDVKGFTFSDTFNGNTIKLLDSNIPNNKFMKNDELLISTKRGERSINLLRNGSIISLLNALDKESEWIMLRRGVNEFTYYATESGTSSADNMLFIINSQIIYGGI